MNSLSKKQFTQILFVLIVCIFLVNTIAQVEFLYWRYWWFDMPMHFSGGVFLGFLITYSILFVYKPSSFSQKKMYWVQIIFFFVLVLSLGWEFYEFFVDHNFSTRLPNYLDTVSDLFFDMAGSCVSILVLLKKKIF